MSRAYTVAELDRMRAAIRRKIPGPQILSSTQKIGSPCGEWTEGTRADLAAWDARCEDALRTYLIAGISPDELEESVSRKPAALTPQEEGLVRRALSGTAYKLDTKPGTAGNG